MLILFGRLEATFGNACVSILLNRLSSPLVIEFSQKPIIAAGLKEKSPHGEWQTVIFLAGASLGDASGGNTAARFQIFPS